MGNLESEQREAVSHITVGTGAFSMTAEMQFPSLVKWARFVSVVGLLYCDWFFFLAR